MAATSNSGIILVFGATGQVGRALESLLGSNCKALNEVEADFRDTENLKRILEAFQPSVLINAAAYTAVDKAEENRELAHQINSVAPGVLARWCAEKRVPFIHFSTDYVYPGDGTAPWKETDGAAPRNWYGQTKLEGDLNVIQAGGKWLILRTSWVYDATGANFLKTMLRVGAERPTLRIVADQVGAPTFARHLAQATLQALEAAQRLPVFPSDVYHCCNSGETSWHGFAEAIFQEVRERPPSARLPLAVQSVEPITTDAYPTPARRPRNSRMDLEKIRTVLGVTLPDWRKGLKECMTELMENLK